MVEVRIDAGLVRGETANGISVFRGLPFAAPPFGPNRFRAPQPVQPWNGVREATEYGRGCPQPMLTPSPETRAYTGPVSQGEDCLNLNVWTPDPGGSGLPVMIWIHGGGYVSGSGSALAHEGSTWARDGIVYVSVNYRLHVEGFLYLGRHATNLGLLDHVAALQWVQRNIAAFGGDPGNVTIFGESGGAVSVMSLLAMPSATGLFRRAIAQSGSPRVAVSVDEATAVTRRLSEILGVEPTVEALTRTPLDRILPAAVSLVMEFADPKLWHERSFLISPFAAVVDGDTLPERIVPAVGAGASADVDLMAGTCCDEATGFSRMHQQLGLVDDAWRNSAYQTFGLSPRTIERYRTASRSGATEMQLLETAWSDWVFRLPTMSLLDAHAPHRGRTYCYEFAWPSATQPELGATHSLDLAFVFDRLESARKALLGAEDRLGDDPPQELADSMHRAWVQFATHGNPGWPAYELDRRLTMRFDAMSAAVSAAAGEQHTR